MQTARIGLSGARGIYIGPGLDLAPHRNAAATVALALDAPFTLELARRTESHLVALIPPNALHHLRAGGPMAFLYLDAASDDWRTLAASDLASRAADIRAVNVATLAIDAIFERLAIPRRRVAGDDLSAVVHQLDRRPQDFERVEDAARLAGLSPSWFQARFRRTVGMPFRRYRLWRRMAVVLGALANGSNLTAAAHQAGFSSSAHLSSTFRAMFGLSPSEVWSLGVTLESDAGPPE